MKTLHDTENVDREAEVDIRRVPYNRPGAVCEVVCP